MPRLFFHLTNGEETILDHEGAEVAPNDVGQITTIVDEIRSEEPELLDTEGWSVVVVDEDGRSIANVPLHGAPKLPLVPDNAAFQTKLAELPLASYYAGDSVITDGSTTGRLFVLKTGAVAIIKGGLEIGKVTEPGAVLGELSVLLNSPHMADVVALEATQFYVADSASEFMRDPLTLIYVATLLARRLDLANKALIDLKQQVEEGESRVVIGETVDQIARVLSASSVTMH